MATINDSTGDQRKSSGTRLSSFLSTKNGNYNYQNIFSFLKDFVGWTKFDTFTSYQFLHLKDQQQPSVSDSLTPQELLLKLCRLLPREIPQVYRFRYRLPKASER